MVIFLIVSAIQVYGQNQKSQGYMGLWSRSVKSPEYGYKYSGGLGTFSSQHRPVAIYSPVADKTYFVYCGTRSPEESHLQIMISYYDHRLHRVPKPVIVYDKMGVTDPQDNASLSIGPGGYIWVFISGRGRTRPGLIFKSRLPWSIESFDMVMEGEMLFPQPWCINGSSFILLHSRLSRGRELYWSSSKDGSEWTESEKIAGFGGHFQVSATFENSIYTVFNYYPAENMDKRTNLYLLKTDDLGKTWKSADNKIVEIPVTEGRNKALIKDFESENKLVFINDLSFDSEGNPVILAIVSSDFRPGPVAERSLMVIRWKDGEWYFSKVCPTDHNFDLGQLYISEKEWKIIAPSEGALQKNVTGGEMQLWISRNEGVDWEKTYDITENSEMNNSYPRRPLNAHREFSAFWVDGDAEKRSPSQLYFTNAKGDKVWRLPYVMKSELERPVRIK